MKTKKEVLTSVRFSRETYARLKELANSKETTVAAIVREATVIFLSSKSNKIQ